MQLVAASKSFQGLTSIPRIQAEVKDNFKRKLVQDTSTQVKEIKRKREELQLEITKVDLQLKDVHETLMQLSEFSQASITIEQAKVGITEVEESVNVEKDLVLCKRMLLGKNSLLRSIEHNFMNADHETFSEFVPDWFGNQILPCMHLKDKRQNFSFPADYSTLHEEVLTFVS